MRLSLLISIFIFSLPAQIMGAASFVEIIFNQDPRISYSLDWKTVSLRAAHV